MNSKEDYGEQRGLRRLAVAAIAISTTAVIASIVAMPLLYSYIATLQSHISAETEFCQTRTRDLWHTMGTVETTGRAKRGWLFGQWVPDGGAGGGAAGGYGDGDAGNDGNKGRDGTVESPEQTYAEPCMICPPGPIGVPGPAGHKGPQGPRGHGGAPGQDGRRGEPGMAGAAGLQGEPGQPGKAGKKGDDGRVITLPGPPGPTGARGPQGRQGERGTKGRPGIVIPGAKGEQGDSNLVLETDFCKSRARDMWSEMEVTTGVSRQRRETGSWLFGQFVPQGGQGGGYNEGGGGGGGGNGGQQTTEGPFKPASGHDVGSARMEQPVRIVPSPHVIKATGDVEKPTVSVRPADYDSFDDDDGPSNRKEDPVAYDSFDDDDGKLDQKENEGGWRFPTSAGE
ncbi:unnamed protein product, partial [Mesorhabditis spiculigera]